MRFVLFVSAVSVFSLCIADVSAADEPGYLKLVRAYADAMIDNGRDTYGEQHSPLLSTTLNRKTMEPVTDAPDIGGIRNSDRMVTGGNPMHEQNLYQVMYALTNITGDQRYASEADRTLSWFFRHCQSRQTDLLAWGEHMGWDFQTEAIIVKPGGTIHEYYRPWILWEQSFRLAPVVCRRFALGVWNHQIADQMTCEYSRHARYDQHGPDEGSEYPRHGGFYIATWATAYGETRAPVFLTAIERLTDSFDARRHPKTDALMAETISPEMMWPPSNLSLAIDLWDTAAQVPPKLAAKLRSSAARTDKVFLQMKHDMVSKEKGFVLHANTSTLEPGYSRRGKVSDAHSFTETWATSYGTMTDAQYAMMCVLRYEQTKNDDYKKLVLDTAKKYLTSDPDLDITLYPGALGDAIALMLAAHRITSEDTYLDRADHFGRISVKLFFDDSPLPRASSNHDHYEAITRADTLIMELLNVWAAKQEPALQLKLVYNDR